MNLHRFKLLVNHTIVTEIINMHINAYFRYIWTYIIFWPLGATRGTSL